MKKNGPVSLLLLTGLLLHACPVLADGDIYYLPEDCDKIETEPEKHRGLRCSACGHIILNPGLRITQMPTCIHKGRAGCVCSDCHRTVYVTVSAPGHYWSKHTPIMEDPIR